MSHVSNNYIHDWVVLHIWKRNTYHWVVSHICKSHVEWVMSHVWMRHGTHIRESSRRSDVTRMNQACRTHMQESHHTYKRKESRGTYERVTSHIWTSHVTHTNTSLDPGDTRKAWRQKQSLSDSRQYSQVKILKSQVYNPFT